MTAHPSLPSVVAGALYCVVVCTCPAQIAFAPSQLHAVGAATRHVVPGDWNRDHRPDLAIASDAGLVVLTSLCGGGFASPQPLAPGLVLPLRGALAAGDVDGDGADDLVAVVTGAQPTVGEIVVLRSRGDGTFDAPVVSAVLPTPIAGETITPEAVALGDLDGDGRLDVAVSATLHAQVSVPGYIAIALGQSGGGFATAVVLPTGQSFTSGVALGDMDQDGDLDVVVSNWADHSISILLNDGSGTNGTIGTERVGRATGALPTRICLGDVDGDGWTDVCVLRDNSVHPLLGLGAIDPRRAGLVRDTGITILVGSQATPPLDVAADVALADLDRDRVLDLVVAITPSLGGTGRVVALQGLGAAAFAAEQPISQAHAAIDLAVADLDGDGDDDVVAASGPQTDLIVCTNAALLPRWTDVGFAFAGSLGAPCLDGLGMVHDGAPTHVRMTNAPPLSLGGVLVSPARWDLPLLGAVLVPDLNFGGGVVLLSDPRGTMELSFAWPATAGPGSVLWWQAWALDLAAPAGFCASNALRSQAQ